LLLLLLLLLLLMLLLLFLLLLLLTVYEVQYEKIPATFDATTLNESKELRFSIPASSDFFTRYTVSPKVL
jgi:hypothetical protein